MEKGSKLIKGDLKTIVQQQKITMKRDECEVYEGKKKKERR